MALRICLVLAFATVALCAAIDVGSPPNQETTFRISDFLEVRNSDEQMIEATPRSQNGFDQIVTDYVRNNDVTFNLPIIGPISVSGKSLSDDESDLEISMDDEEVVEGRRKKLKIKKHKLKKIFVPIFIIVLLKVITLIPLALGVLGLKTWNALQLSFVTFVISISMAVYQLCKKLAADSHPPIASHGPWDVHHARSFDGFDGQKMAYSAYTP